ncbi:MAG: hypothetical protein IJY24_04455 [Clostridia bacterium]|nr:hypothetical protein [Clostridia bacterium]
MGWACREGTRLFALSFRHSQARATSLPKGGFLACHPERNGVESKDLLNKAGSPLSVSS